MQRSLSIDQDQLQDTMMSDEFVESSHYEYNDNDSLALAEEGNHQKADGGSGFGTEESNETIAKKETRAVFWIKITVFTVLVVATITAALLTYFTLSREQTDDLETQFKDFSTKIIDNFYRSTSMKLWTANTIGITYTSYAASVGSSFPNVTLPDTLIRFAGARRLANATAITFAPMLKTDQDRLEWEAYAIAWKIEMDETPIIPPIGEGNGDIDNQGDRGLHTSSSANQDREISDGIYSFNYFREKKDYPYGVAPYFPIWQISPTAKNNQSIMWNQMSHQPRRDALGRLVEVGGAQFSEVFNDDETPRPSHVPHDGPMGVVYYPTVDTFYERERSGAVGVEYKWIDYFGDFPSGLFNGITIVLESTCGQMFTFEIQENVARFIGQGDLHDEDFNSMVQRSTYQGFHALCHYGYEFWGEVYNNGRLLGDLHMIGDDGTINDMLPDISAFSNLPEEEDIVEDHTCHYAIRVYPSRPFEAKYMTNQPSMFALYVALIFIFTAALFIVYDCLVERRQSLTMEAAIQSSAVVNALFPAQFRDRMFHQSNHSDGPEQREGGTWKSESLEKPDVKKRRLIEPPKLMLKSFLTDLAPSDAPSETIQSAPIADLFPNVTIMFADIAGFTAWSSEREPKDVFTLLETLYGAFDKLANKLGVFKVETIGDCYVAATGMPNPQEDHAVIMARFSYECLCAMNVLSRKLEATLGPGTSDLALRIGIHSGPVTAGVLRGEKSRFQLFGDSMNTASRMESNSVKNMIQVSSTTADLLVAANKQQWLTPREDLVKAKGKGDMQTYWLRPTTKRNSCPSSGDSVHSTTYARRHSSMAHGGRLGSMSFATTSSVYGSIGNGQHPGQSKKRSKWGDTQLEDENSTQFDAISPSSVQRLVEWNVDVLATALEKVVQLRKDAESVRLRRRSSVTRTASYVTSDINPIDEVVEIIDFPKFDKKLAKRRQATSEPLSSEVREELFEFVTHLATKYHVVPFHNIQHASHVTMSANKLIKRIILPDDIDYGEKVQEVAANQHKISFGLSSDPISHFAIVFSALIHDVDHTGLPNSQLVQEEYGMAAKYKNKSIAEQNSLDAAWSILMGPRYERLRVCIFENKSEQKRFRQLLVNCVMATDIMDEDMVALRRNRWEKAFAESDDHELDQLKNNRKATIVVEHIIQASDVAHTMQHWHVYTKWNERLFQEQYKAYLNGHATKNPAIGWYEGEIWFFDNYIIPLANKLRECGVFGVSSDEYLGFALDNRREWEQKGRAVCEAIVCRAQQKYGYPLVPNTIAPKAG